MLNNNETIEVYLETKTDSQLVATFYDEAIYILCLPALEKLAHDNAAVITESIVTTDSNNIKERD